MYKILSESKNLIEAEIYEVRIQLDKNVVRKALFDVERWQHGDNNFSAQLIGLIAKADFSNRTKLLHSFPEHVFAYLLWFHQDKMMEEIGEV